jgi:hypothetical protein
VGVLESLNTRRALTTAVVGAVVAAAALVFGLKGACTTAPAGGQAGGPAGKCFFSADDGKSWFPDDASKLPPIDHEGKAAYRVRVFRCPDGKLFVSHLERYAPADKKRLEELRNAPGGANAMVMEQTTFMQIGEVKKPGDAQWIRLTPETSEQYQRVTQPKCPDGSTVGLQPVLPE